MKKSCTIAVLIDYGFQIHEGNPTDFLSKIKMLSSVKNACHFDNYTFSVNYLMKNSGIQYT